MRGGLPFVDTCRMCRFEGPSHHDPDHDQDRDEAGNERGAGLVEYALLVSLLILVCLAAVELLGDATTELYSSAVTGLQ